MLSKIYKLDGAFGYSDKNNTNNPATVPHLRTNPTHRKKQTLNKFIKENFVAV